MSDILEQHDHKRLSRRGWLRMAGAAVGGLATTGGAVAAASTQSASAMSTPDGALKVLMEGNARFVGGLSVTRRDLMRVKEVAPRQTPFAAVLGCADSRVPVELVFDQGFGDVFVCRAAGNVATPELIASLEFGTHVLGAKVLMVLGHTSCGAVVAAAERTAAPGQISALYQHLRPAVERAGGDTAKAVTENVRIQTKLLGDASPVLAKLVTEGKLKIVGGVYDLATGAVTLVS